MAGLAHARFFFGSAFAIKNVVGAGFKPLEPPRDSADRSIPGRIAAHAAAAPNKLAVEDAGRQLSYRQLERESDRLAARLQAAGAAPERCVAILLDRSTEFFVAALATLKTGGAYVAIDASTPFERLQAILRDADAACVVTSVAIARTLPKVTPQFIVVDDPDVTQIRSFEPAQIAAETLANVVYTSGSTGTPKGVEITHGNLCNLIEWHQSAFAVTASDRASQIASLGFDAAGWEIWPYLTAGSSVHVVDECTRRSPELLCKWLVEREITISFVPTVLAQELFRQEWPAGAKLRALLTGGDALQQRPPATLPFRAINNYGPTECTVVATSGVVAPEGASTDVPSIGEAIANATAMVLDDNLQAVPSGESGELCIGGAGVARGYRNLAELTAQRFVTHETAPGHTLRIYRTGDRARVLESGEIEFLGRMDDQVKIRGYRIDLGEIETCLTRSREIVAGAVTRIDDPNSGPALVAYVVLAENAALTESALRERLASYLPSYMIPSFFVAVRELPVTANGKLDKAALPAPSAENALGAGTATATQANESALEREIGELVASLLARPSIGPDDNFFLIGAHSMFGVQLVSRIREAFGVKLTLRHIFTTPTVRELCEEIQRLRSAA